MFQLQLIPKNTESKRMEMQIKKTACSLQLHKPTVPAETAFQMHTPPSGQERSLKGSDPSTPQLAQKQSQGFAGMQRVRRPMRSFSLRLNSSPKIRTHVAVLSWLSSILKITLKNIGVYISWSRLIFHFSNFFFLRGILASCACHNFKIYRSCAYMSL